MPSFSCWLLNTVNGIYQDHYRAWVCFPHVSGIFIGVGRVIRWATNQKRARPLLNVRATPSTCTNSYTGFPHNIESRPIENVSKLKCKSKWVFQYLGTVSKLLLHKVEKLLSDGGELSCDLESALFVLGHLFQLLNLRKTCQWEPTATGKHVVWGVSATLIHAFHCLCGKSLLVSARKSCLHKSFPFTIENCDEFLQEIQTWNPYLL